MSQYTCDAVYACPFRRVWGRDYFAITLTFIQHFRLGLDSIYSYTASTDQSQLCSMRYVEHMQGLLHHMFVTIACITCDGKQVIDSRVVVVHNCFQEGGDSILSAFS